MIQDVAVELTQISHRFKSEAELQHGRQCSSTSIGAVIITVIFREARGASCDNTAEDEAPLPHNFPTRAIVIVAEIISVKQQMLKSHAK